jgi:membrane fusion protein, heavy metal efflux system
VVPLGRTVTVSAPMAGTVLAAGAELARPGARVKRGQVVMRLFALPSAADLAAAESRLETARKRAQRAQQLLEQGAVAERANEDAQLELKLAEANLAAARPSGGGGGKLALPRTASRDCILRDVRVGDGQSVAAGTVLFQVDALDELWVRAPLFAGDVALVAPGTSATVRSLSVKANDPGREARPAAAPPAADPLAVSVDLFFSVPNDDRAFQPGERVMVSVPLSGGEDALVAPWSALVYDVQGGAWVYEAAGAQTFVRRRVEVKHRSGDTAVLAHGPAIGTRVVTAGVLELFGVEFGAGH